MRSACTAPMPINGLGLRNPKSSAASTGGPSGAGLRCNTRHLIFIATASNRGASPGAPPHSHGGRAMQPHGGARRQYRGGPQRCPSSDNTPGQSRGQDRARGDRTPAPRGSPAHGSRRGTRSDTTPLPHPRCPPPPPLTRTQGCPARRKEEKTETLGPYPRTSAEGQATSDCCRPLANRRRLAINRRRRPESRRRQPPGVLGWGGKPAATPHPQRPVPPPPPLLNSSRP